MISISENDFRVIFPPSDGFLPQSEITIEEGDQVRDLIFYYRGTRLFAVRQGPWKLHFITQSAYVND